MLAPDWWGQLLVQRLGTLNICGAAPAAVEVGDSTQPGWAPTPRRPAAVQAAVEAESNNLRDWVLASQSQMAAQAALKVESNTLPGWVLGRGVRWEAAGTSQAPLHRTRAGKLRR